MLLILPAEGLEIVRDGNPSATIVVDSGANGQIKDAADILASCIEEATKAKLPVAPALPESGNAICIGRGAWSAALNPDLAGLDEDGFLVAFPDARTMVIIGPTDSGTEFGVYEVLERYVGVRWLMPGPNGTDIPAHKTIDVPPEPIRQEPSFFSRLFSGLAGDAQQTWARRNRMRGRVNFHHNLLHVFPPETYAKTHPEFFPMRKGARFLPEGNNVEGWQPCFTAPGIVEEAVANINTYFDAHLDATSYSLGVNDSSGYCECERCLARISGAKNSLGLVDHSDLFYDWANRVIEGVLAKHPDKWFGCLAYSEVADPPKNVNVHPRLVPYMTYDRMKWVDGKLRATGEALTQAWHVKSPVVGWYDYIYGTPYVLPRVWFHHMADYYRFGHDNGVRALYAEAYPNWGEGPKLYVALKLQWDPNRDVDALLKDWYVRCVGEEAAPYLAQYYAHWETFWTECVRKSAWFTEAGQYLDFSSPAYLRDVALDEIKESRSLLETVLAKAATNKQKARAKVLLDAFEYYEATAYAFKMAAEEGNAVIESEKEAIELLNGIDEAARYAEKRRHLALHVFPNDPLLVHPIPITQGDSMLGDTWAGGGLWRVYDLAAREDGPVRARIRLLGETAQSPSMKSQAAMMLALIEGRMQPLTQNASFEDGAGDSPKGWSLWVKFGTGTMRRTDELAHSGRYSVLCDGVKRGGPNQVLDVTAGKYGLVCFVYVPAGQIANGTIELSMTLRDGGGNNLPSSSSKVQPVSGRWAAVGVVADVPAKIGEAEVEQVMPILIVDGFEPSQRVYIDDLVLCRLGEH
jgi:hypothetical protein